MQKSNKKKTLRPPQRQLRQPGLEAKMKPLPKAAPKAQPAGRLQDKVALITGGDSGIGRAVAWHLPHRGACSHRVPR